MPKGEKLLKFLASLIVRQFYGTVTIRFEAGKVTHVETETRWMWQYKELPAHSSGCDHIRKIAASHRCSDASRDDC